MQWLGLGLFISLGLILYALFAMGVGKFLRGRRG